MKEPKGHMPGGSIMFGSHSLFSLVSCMLEIPHIAVLLNREEENLSILTSRYCYPRHTVLFRGKVEKYYWTPFFGIIYFRFFLC